MIWSHLKMEWDCLQPRDYDAEYVYGGQWYTLEEINMFAKQSRYIIPEFRFNEANLKLYHAEWESKSAEIINMRPLRTFNGAKYGVNVELSFEEYIKTSCLSDFTIEIAGKYNDYVHRTDFFLKKDSLTIPIDVKALKSVRDHRRQNKYFWVELHSNGFLFSKNSKSTLLVVECIEQPQSKKFILLNKNALKELVQEKFKPSLLLPPVISAPQAYLRPYRRNGEKQEWVGFLDFKDVLEQCAVSFLF